MGKRINKDEKEVLSILYTTDGGVVHFQTDRVSGLIDRGLVEQNPHMVDENGLASRLTEEGLKKAESFVPKAEPETELEVVGGYVGEVELDDEVEVEPEAIAVVEEIATVQPETEPELTPIEPELVIGEPKLEPELEDADEIELDAGIEIPKVLRRPRGSYKYPFEKMEVGHSFHIAATEDRPKPARTLASTVSTASRKLGRVFRVRSVAKDDPKGVGARVFRLE